MITALKKQREEIEEVIKKVFASFDKDGSGFLDVAELKQVSKEMGRELDSAEIDECMKDLDIDKDNKISYKEFSKWWLSGRQGLSPWIRRLMASKLTALKLIDHLSAPVKAVLADATQSDAEDIATNSLTISINKIEEGKAGFSLDAKILILSPELDKEHLRVRTLHSFPETSADVIASLSIAIKHESIFKVQAHFEELKEWV